MSDVQIFNCYVNISQIPLHSYIVSNQRNFTQESLESVLKLKRSQLPSKSGLFGLMTNHKEYFHLSYHCMVLECLNVCWSHGLYSIFRCDGLNKQIFHTPRCQFKGPVKIRRPHHQKTSMKWGDDSSAVLQQYRGLFCSCKD